MDFANYWQYTDMVTKFLFFALIALSILSWITGILRIYHSYKLKNTVVDDLKQAINTEQGAMASLSNVQRKTVAEQILLQQIGRYRYSGDKGLPILGTTAAIAPFIGLFGTVWGIFHALHNIGATGQAGLGQVAGPVGEALIMTGLGLAVAIPAVIFYNIAVRLNRRTLFIANDNAHGILSDTAKTHSASDEVGQKTVVLEPTTTPNTVQTDAKTNELSSSTTTG